jgi:hypothetical protein
MNIKCEIITPLLMQTRKSMKRLLGKFIKEREMRSFLLFIASNNAILKHKAKSFVIIATAKAKK